MVVLFPTFTVITLVQSCEKHVFGKIVSCYFLPLLTFRLKKYIDFKKLVSLYDVNHKTKEEKKSKMVHYLEKIQLFTLFIFCFHSVQWTKSKITQMGKLYCKNQLATSLSPLLDGIKNFGKLCTTFEHSSLF